MLALRIPDSAFLAGAPLEGASKNRTALYISCQTRGGALAITNTPISIEDWEFHPVSSPQFSEIFNLMKKGVLEIVHDGVVSDEADMINIYRTYWEEF